MILDLKAFSISAGAIARHGERIGHRFTSAAVLRIVERKSTPKAAILETIQELWACIPPAYKTTTKVPETMTTQV